MLVAVVGYCGVVNVGVMVTVFVRVCYLIVVGVLWLSLCLGSGIGRVVVVVVMMVWY